MKFYIPNPYGPTVLEQLAESLDKSRTVSRIVQRMIAAEPLDIRDVNALGGKAQVAQLYAPELTFDTALPQDWLDHWTGSDYDNVRMGTVWAYPKGHLFGLPFPVSDKAWFLLSKRED